MVEIEVRRIIALETLRPFTPETIEQVAALLQIMRDCCPIPDVDKGYWSTISFHWHETSRGPTEIEVFGDRIEFYRYRDQHTEMEEYAQKPGEQFSEAILSELPTAVASPDTP